MRTKVSIFAFGFLLCILSETAQQSSHVLRRQINTMEPKMITHTLFYFWGIKCPITQGRTSGTKGFLAGLVLCDLGAYKGLFVNVVPITHITIGAENTTYIKNWWEFI